MNHEDLERELPWYVNGTMDDETAARIERELPGCATCADELAEIRTLRDALRETDAHAAEVPATLADDVFRRIGTNAGELASDAVTPTKPSNVRKLPLRGIAGGMAVALAASFAFFVSSGHNRSYEAVDGNASGFTAATAGPHFGEDVPQSVAAPPAEEPAPVVKTEAAGAGAARFAPGATADQYSAARSHAATIESLAARQRKLARTGEIGLIVSDVPAALAKIDRLANAQFGAVTGLEDNSPSVPGETHSAHVSLSVPSDRFGASLDAIAALGGVTTRNVKTEDLTDSMVDTEARLRNLRHEESDLLKIMDRQGKVGDILDVEQQLATTRETIEQLDAQDKSMEQRVSYSTIEIDLTDEKHVQVAVPGPGSEIGASWDRATRAAWHFTLNLVEFALTLLAFGPYLLVLALIAWIVYRKWFRPMPSA